MARKRASMREGPLAELFKATEAAQRQTEQKPEGASERSAEPHVEEAPEPQRRLEPVESVVVDMPVAPTPVPAEEPARERTRPEIWDVTPEPPILHAVPRPDSGTYVAPSWSAA